MATTLWSGLNIILLIGLLYIFYRAAMLVRQHIGLGAALFFSFGLLLAGCHRADKRNEASANLLANRLKSTPLGNASAQQAITLGMGSKLILLAEYYQEAGAIQPRGLYSTPTGFLLGHTWQPLAGHLQPQSGQLRYFLALKHTWQLLGQPIFSQTEQFEGIFSPSHPL